MYYIVSYSYLLLPLAFLLFKCKLKDKVPLLISIYGLFCFLFLYAYGDSPSSSYIPKEFKKYAQTFYTFLEYFFFTLIFWYNVRSKSFKPLVLTTAIAFIIFQIIFVINTTHRRLDSVPIGIETILLFIYIFYFFYEFSRQTKDTFIYNHHTFWIAVGIMIYLGGSFFFYILINHLENDEVAKLGNLTYVAEIIKNIFFVFSIFMYKKFPVNGIHNRHKNIPNLDMI